MAEAKRKKLAIIDGKSVFYRGYYAMGNLATKDGTPTGGVFGFATMALEVIRKLKPDYVCVAWDKPKTNIRKRLEIYPEYKAGRKPAPPDFYDQIKILQKLLEAFGWPLYELDDYEADDIMGTLAAQASKKDIETLLITSDLDMLQVVNERVHVYALKKGLSNIELYSPKSFEVKYGIKVNQFLDMKSLKGDSSDNIPGVPGIGEKGAIDLIKRFETLDGVFENIDLITGATAKKLKAGRDSAYMSKELARIYINAPIKLKLTDLDGSKCQPEKVLELLEKLEFRTLARQLPEVMQVKISDHQKISGQQKLTVGKIELIDSSKKLAAVNLSGAEQLFVYSRAAGRHGKKPQLLVLSKDGELTHVLDLTKVSGVEIREFLVNLKASLVGHDIKSTLKILLELGLMELPEVKHDTQVAEFLLNSLERDLTLTHLTKEKLNYEINLDNLDNGELTARAADAIAVIKALYEEQQKKLTASPKLKKLAEGIEWPIIPVLARMEKAGIELNINSLKKLGNEIDDLISDYEQQIYGYADEEFNIGSPGQLANILFQKLKLSTVGIKRGKTFYSTAASELGKLRGLHPIIDLISQYREVTKLKNTYVDTLPKLTDEYSRIHTTFNLTIAQTGRLSSEGPNLQNIPVRTDLGRRIRTAFIAGDGRKFVSADYSQFELRLAACLSDDKQVIDMFNRGADVHTMTAAQVYGRAPEDVTKQMRYAAKAVNFGIMYGQGAHALALGTGMSFAQAKDFIEKYFEIRPKLKGYIDKTREQANTKGYVETIFGRRRPTPDVRSSNFVVREGAYRAAVNMPIQGSAADIMKLAMIKIDELLRSQHNDCKMLLQIHDSILIECPAEVAERIAELLKDTMENIYELPVRLDVEVSIGNNWGEL